MINFVYETEQGVVVGVALEEASIDVPEYLIVERQDLPLEPIESWDIEDGQIKIDQQKLIDFNRKNMPTLTPIEFDIKLNNAGLYDAVQGLIKDNFEMRIAYNRATFFSRTDPFIDQARIALDLTGEQVDAMWEQAITL